MSSTITYLFTHFIQIQQYIIQFQMQNTKFLYKHTLYKNTYQNNQTKISDYWLLLPPK